MAFELVFAVHEGEVAAWCIAGSDSHAMCSSCPGASRVVLIQVQLPGCCRHPDTWTSHYETGFYRSYWFPS